MLENDTSRASCDVVAVNGSWMRYQVCDEIINIFSLFRRINGYVAVLTDAFIDIFTNYIGWGLDKFICCFLGTVLFTLLSTAGPLSELLSSHRHLCFEILVHSKTILSSSVKPIDDPFLNGTFSFSRYRYESAINVRKGCLVKWIIESWCRV